MVAISNESRSTTHRSTRRSRMVIGIGLGVLGLVGALALFIASRPSSYHIERKRTIGASPQVVHAIVNDLHEWKRFNSWEALDPNIQREFGGPASGPGAWMHWTGNSDVGEGRSTIEASTPESIRLKLEFMKPMAGLASATFTFQPVAGGTEVTWAMDGTSGFMCKAMGLFMNMEQMIGGMHEKGLASLEAAALADAKVAATTP
jgi:hypothetical protein